MAEKRKPLASLLLRKPGKKACKIEVFDAALFEQGPDETDALPHDWPLYRLRVDGRWLCRRGEQLTVFDADGLWSWFQLELFGVVFRGVDVPLPADFAPGDRVTVRYELAGVPRAEMGIVRSAPLRDQAGRQLVLVATGGPMRVALFPVDDVEVRG